MRYLTDAWLVLLLSLIFGATLAGVEMGLGERIRQNRLNETLSQIPTLVPGAEKGEKAEVGDIKQLFKALNADGTHAGWVLQVQGDGYADTITVLIGVDAKVETLTGIYVLEQKETPGLGNKIENEKWRAQFRGKSVVDTLVGATKTTPTEPWQVKAVTGATISSQSVCDIVNDGVKKLREALQAEKTN